MRTPSKNTFFYRTFLMAASMNLHSLVCLNVKELLAQRRCHIWSSSDSNGIWNRNHLVRKRTLNNLAKLAKNLIFLMNVLPDVYICSLRKKSAPLLPEGIVKCTHWAVQQIHRMLTEINKSGVITKIRIWVESDTVKH